MVGFPYPWFLLHFSPGFQAKNRFWFLWLFYPLTISDFSFQDVFFHAQHCNYCVLYSFFATLGPKTSLGYNLLLMGCFHPPWQLILLPNHFPLPRNCVYYCVCLCAVACVELGVEMGLDQLDKSSAWGTSLRELEGWLFLTAHPE